MRLRCEVDQRRLSIRTIAFYLPQFHPIPENDLWWGKGFTEWTNVTRAKALIPGHYQPHLPADLGFYDLRLPEARASQAELAKEYGISGFCYYHYWFNGRRVLNRPIDEVVDSGQPDFPFCLCWANENWTRAWDGGPGQILLEQNHSHADDLAHIRFLLPILSDRRYIRVDGRPLLLVYRTELLPNPARTAELWRNEALAAGLGDLFLARVESFSANIDPAIIGFDAAVEFAPDWRMLAVRRSVKIKRWLSSMGMLSENYAKHRFVEYDDMLNAMLNKPMPTFSRYRCVTPGFDNSARRTTNATIIINSTPDLYRTWLQKTLTMECVTERPKDGSLVFINAWNEWAEGCHLEPDQKWGRAYLKATKTATDSIFSLMNDCKKKN